MTDRVHPLMLDDAQKIGDWDRWMLEWTGSTFTPSYETRLNLLSRGLEFPLSQPSKQAQRIIFYLRCADGHKDLRSFGFDSTETNAKARQESRRKALLKLGLAERAFSASMPKLPQTLVALTAPGFGDVLYEPGLLEELVWFVRVNPNSQLFYNLDLPESARLQYNSNQFAIEFTKALCQFLAPQDLEKNVPAEHLPRALELSLQLLPAAALLGLRESV